MICSPPCSLPGSAPCRVQIQGTRARLPPRGMLLPWGLGACHTSAYSALACCEGPQRGWCSPCRGVAEGPPEGASPLWSQTLPWDPGLGSEKAGCLLG